MRTATTDPALRFSPLLALVTCGTCVLLVGAAQRVLGVPGMAQVRQFMSGGRPSGEATLATASLLVWVTLGGACAWFAATSFRGLGGELEQRRLALRQGTVVLFIGLALLVVGGFHQHSATLRVCCGSVEEAAQNLGR